MIWLLLTVTILLEVAGTIFMKLSLGLSKLVPSVLMIICYFLCFALFSIVTKKLDLGMAYAIWSGVGTSLIFIVSVMYFNETFSVLKVISLVFIIIGVIGLRVSITA